MRLGFPSSRIGRATLFLAVAFLAYISGIATAIVINIRANDATACQQEYTTVQSALDAYMAYFNITTVTAGSANDMRVKPDGTHPLFQEPTSPLYVMNAPTVYTYTWDGFGRITTISRSPGGPSVPAACVVSGG